MPGDELRVLLLADTHLGFDAPRRPRVVRRRRGPDFFANFELALEPALRREVDLVVHGGDLLFRSRVPASLVDRALAPLKSVADAGVPVILVLEARPETLVSPRAGICGSWCRPVRGLRIAILRRGWVASRGHNATMSAPICRSPCSVSTPGFISSTVREPSCSSCVVTG